MWRYITKQSFKGRLFGAISAKKEFPPQPPGSRGPVEFESAATHLRRTRSGDEAGAISELFVHEWYDAIAGDLGRALAGRVEQVTAEEATLRRVAEMLDVTLDDDRRDGVEVEARAWENVARVCVIALLEGLHANLSTMLDFDDWVVAAGSTEYAGAFRRRSGLNPVLMPEAFRVSIELSGRLDDLGDPVPFLYRERLVWLEIDAERGRACLSEQAAVSAMPEHAR
jgi:hypothetical protein